MVKKMINGKKDDVEMNSDGRLSVPLKAPRGGGSRRRRRKRRRRKKKNRRRRQHRTKYITNEQPILTLFFLIPLPSSISYSNHFLVYLYPMPSIVIVLQLLVSLSSIFTLFI
jgi:hypothetical protein